MTDIIVGLIGVMLIVYLFIMVLRPERKWDRLFKKDSSAAAQWLYGSGHKDYDKAEVSDSGRGRRLR